MRKGVLFALGLLCTSLLFLVAPAGAADKPQACGLGCFVAKSQDERQCVSLQADVRRDCLEKASLKYRMCTTTCATSPEVKTTPAPTVVKSSVKED
jgi:hypothetical protein